MNNQDLAQSDMQVAQTPHFSDPDDERRANAAGMGPQPVEKVDDALVEVENMPRTPAEAAESAPAEPRDLSPAQLSEERAAETQVAPEDAGAREEHGTPPPVASKWLGGLTPFWRDRLIETGLILSMGLYYLVGNPNFGEGNFLHLPPYLYSFPFLAIFAILTWYRLAFTVALMPLALPYYYLAPKAIFSLGKRNFEFSLAEITLAVCILVALAQLLVYGKQWRYRLSWAEIRARVGPFLIPIAVFVLAAFFSIVIAASRQAAFRAFHEEVAAPLLYGLLAFCCLRTRGDLKRLLWAFLGSAMIIAIAGLIQYFFFASRLQTGFSGDRVIAMYGNANSIGLFFDYALPFGLALLIFQVSKTLHTGGKWWPSLLILAGFVPLVAVLAFSQSLGSALALPIALLFILAMSVRSRKTLLIGAGVLVVLGLGGGFVLRHQISHFLSSWHESSQGISTVTKRIYLWESAWHMIQHHAWFGVGMDNWLCYFSQNTVCAASATHTHYWVTLIPGTNQPTGLKAEPDLSHPHNIFLQVWASMGIFALLAFVAVLALFYWLFARIVKTVRHSSHEEIASLEWMVLGVGGAMLAAICQGLVDSSFLEQDLAFCFWTLVAALLILRVFTRTTWRRELKG